MGKKESVRQLGQDGDKKLKDPLNGIFCLYGPHNSGKSTSLGWLIFLLCHYGKCEEEIQELFDNYLRSQKRRKYRDAFPDIIVIVPYKCKDEVKYVYVATKGDDYYSVESNVFFFEGRLIYSKVKIFRNGRFGRLTPGEADYYSLYPPSVCVTACYYGDSVELPMKFYFDKKHPVTCMCTVISISNSGDFKRKYHDYGTYLKRLIDDCLKFPQMKSIITNVIKNNTV